MSFNYQIQIEDDAFVLRLPRSQFDEESLSRLLKYVDYERILQTSWMNSAQAQLLAKETRKNVWEKLKPLVLHDKSA